MECGMASSGRRARKGATSKPTAPVIASWWVTPWDSGSIQDPDAGWELTDAGSLWQELETPALLNNQAIFAPLEAQFGQVRSRDRVRELAEVFTHQREVDAMLELVEDAFSAIDIKFLEPTCGSGNFLVEILRRKLQLVDKANCANQEHYEHQLLRAIASIYGVDISPENVSEARARLAHVLLSHYQSDANTVEPTAGFMYAAALIIGDNVVHGDTLTRADAIELCEWQPASGGRFKRVWSFALVPEAKRDLFWTERAQDAEPVHYSQLATPPTKAVGSRKAARR